MNAEIFKQEYEISYGDFSHTGIPDKGLMKVVIYAPRVEFVFTWREHDDRIIIVKVKDHEEFSISLSRPLARIFWTQVNRRKYDPELHTMSFNDILSERVQ